MKLKLRGDSEVAARLLTQYAVPRYIIGIPSNYACDKRMFGSLGATGVPYFVLAVPANPSADLELDLIMYVGRWCYNA